MKKPIISRKISGIDIYKDRFKFVKNVNHIYPIEIYIIGETEKAIRIQSQVNFKELWLPLKGLVYLKEQKAFTTKKWMRNNKDACIEIMNLFN